MKRTTLNLLFLLLIGLVIGWKEWVISTQTKNEAIEEEMESVKEEGIILFNRSHLRIERIS